jgi:2-polyprenyl-3-methyl-5-hydroxy-6-metoxy-1,4-benzoquinol methylase
MTLGENTRLSMLEQRKIVEAEFHDLLRDPALQEKPELYAKLTSNRKWYSVARKSQEFAREYLRQHSRGARALDYACGDGNCSFVMAESGADVIGIDISDTSVKNAGREAARRGLSARFQVMDCEAMTFPDRSFDLINVNGVLHHMDLSQAYPELARVLKPTGSVLCAEALAHNPVFQTYRKLTPHLRTEFETEHILRRRDILAARKYFNRVEWHFFHLVSLAAVPLRNSRLFEPALSLLEKVDSALLSVSPIRWWAWQIGFVLSDPKLK